MQVVPFCSDNLKKIKREASEIQKLLTQSSFFSNLNADFSVGDLLKGFAAATGYSSWGAVISKNKQKRAYLPFSLHNYRDVKYFGSIIAEHIRVPQNELLIAVSLIQLGANAEKNNIYVPDKKDFCSEQVALVLNKTIGDRNYRAWKTALDNSPLFFMLNFNAIPIDILQPLMPELTNHLCKNLNKTNSQLVVCPQIYDTLYGDADDYNIDRVGLIELTYQDRSLYRSLYELSDLEEEIHESYNHLMGWIDSNIPTPDYESIDDENIISSLEYDYLQKLNNAGIKLKILLRCQDDIDSIMKTKMAYTQSPLRSRVPIELMGDEDQKVLNEFKKAESLYPNGLISSYERRRHCNETWLHGDWHLVSLRMHKQLVTHRQDALSDLIVFEEMSLDHMTSLKDIFLSKDGRSPYPELEIVYPAEPEFYESFKPV